MSRATLYPYQFAERALSLVCEPTGVEFERRPGGHIVLTDELPAGGTLDLRVVVQVNAGTLDSVVPLQEHDDPPVAIAVLIRSTASRVRRMDVLATRQTPSTVEGTIVIGRREFGSHVELAPVLFRLVSGLQPSAYGVHRGALLADGVPTTIYADEPPAPPGVQLEINYERFDTSQVRLRRDNAGSLFALDLSGEAPILWLNSGVDRFEELTRSEARRGIPRRIRDAVYDTIVCQAWTSIIAAAVLALSRTGSDDISRQEALELLRDWQQRVLHLWAPLLFPEEGNRDQALDTLFETARSLDGSLEMEERVTVAVQAMARSQEAFNGLVRVYLNEGI